MNFADIKSLTIPHGEVVKITSGTNVLWEAVTVENKWNLLERTEFRGEATDRTYYFHKNNTGTTMPLDENLYWNGGIHIDDGAYFASHNTKRFCTLSNITENSFTLTSGSGGTENFVAFPFHLNAGETITVTHTRDGHNRSGYQIFNTDGTLRSCVRENLSNSPGAVDVTEFTATDECWFAWICGRYDASTSVTISNIVVTIA